MEQVLIITRVNGNVVTALAINGKIVELNCSQEENLSILGNIYIGKVQNIVANINAAFVEIADKQMCYLSLEDTKQMIVLNERDSEKGKERKIRIGDEILVQVSKEGIKTKEPVVTTNLNFTGKYVVLTTGNKKIGVSSKIPEKERVFLKKKMKLYKSENYGLVVRTNATEAEEAQIEEEIQQMVREYEELIAKASYRKCFSLLKEAPQNHIMNLRDTYSKGLEKIMTDEEDLYQEMEQYLKEYQPGDVGKLKFYKDDLLSLVKLYSIEKVLEDALREKVWLKSGGYLIIEQTEAMVVVDVNTGKFTAKKKTEETFLKINLEAAAEIARQLRLRNLSGIIVIDFIDMTREEHKQQLMESFDSYLKSDPVQCNLIDITGLNLVEVTRKKVKKSLKEQFTVPCTKCNGKGFERI